MSTDLFFFFFLHIFVSFFFFFLSLSAFILESESTHTGLLQRCIAWYWGSEYDWTCHPGSEQSTQQAGFQPYDCNSVWGQIWEMLRKSSWQDSVREWRWVREGFGGIWKDSQPSIWMDMLRYQREHRNRRVWSGRNNDFCFGIEFGLSVGIQVELSNRWSDIWVWSIEKISEGTHLAINREVVGKLIGVNEMIPSETYVRREERCGWSG